MPAKSIDDVAPLPRARQRQRLALSARERPHAPRSALSHTDQTSFHCRPWVVSLRAAEHWPALTFLFAAEHAVASPFTLASTVRLRNGGQLPRLGFGVYESKNTKASTAQALAMGYR